MCRTNNDESACSRQLTREHRPLLAKIKKAGVLCACPPVMRQAGVYCEKTESESTLWPLSVLLVCLNFFLHTVWLSGKSSSLSLQTMTTELLRDLSRCVLSECEVGRVPVERYFTPLQPSLLCLSRSWGCLICLCYTVFIASFSCVCKGSFWSLPWNRDRKSLSITIYLTDENLNSFAKIFNCDYFFKNSKSTLRQCKENSTYEKDGKVYAFSDFKDRSIANMATHKKDPLFKNSIFHCPPANLPGTPSLEELRKLAANPPIYLLYSATVRQIIMATTEFRTHLAQLNTPFGESAIIQQALLVHYYTIGKWLYMTKWEELQSICQELIAKDPNGIGAILQANLAAFYNQFQDEEEMVDDAPIILDNEEGRLINKHKRAKRVMMAMMLLPHLSRGVLLPSLAWTLVQKKRRGRIGRCMVWFCRWLILGLWKISGFQIPHSISMEIWNFVVNPLVAFF